YAIQRKARPCDRSPRRANGRCGRLTPVLNIEPDHLATANQARVRRADLGAEAVRRVHVRIDSIVTVVELCDRRIPRRLKLGAGRRLEPSAHGILTLVRRGEA